MVNKIHRQAVKLGIFFLRETILFAQPKRLRAVFSRSIPDIADIIQNYINLIDPSFIHDISGNPRNSIYRYLAPHAQLYIEMKDKAAGFNMHSSKNHTIQITFYCDNDKHIRKIVYLINNLFENGILDYIDWNKIKKNFGIKAEGNITIWKEFLPTIKPEIPPTQIPHLKVESILPEKSLTIEEKNRLSEFYGNIIDEIIRLMNRIDQLFKDKYSSVRTEKSPQWEEWKKYEDSLKEIGKDLYNKGGEDLMHDIYLMVYEKGQFPGRYLDHVWDGVGTWMG